MAVTHGREVSCSHLSSVMKITVRNIESDPGTRAVGYVMMVLVSAHCKHFKTQLQALFHEKKMYGNTQHSLSDEVSFTAELPVINKCVKNSQLFISNVYVSEKLWRVVKLVSVVLCSLLRSVRVG